MRKICVGFIYEENVNNENWFLNASTIVKQKNHFEFKKIFFVQNEMLHKKKFHRDVQKLVNCKHFLKF